MPSGEIIETDHRMPGLHQPEAGMRADVSGAAGHEDALGGVGGAHDPFSMTHRALEVEKPILGVED